MSSWREKVASASAWAHTKTGEGLQKVIGAVNKHVTGSKTTASHAADRLLSWAGIGEKHDVQFNMQTGKLQVWIPQSAGMKSFFIEGNDARELHTMLMAKLATGMEKSNFAKGPMRQMPTRGAKRNTKRKTLRRKN
jgi:hypothetical protein